MKKIFLLFISLFYIGIAQAQNVGIGTTNPGFPLNFSSAFGDKISLFGNTGNHYGFGIQSNLMQIHTESDAANIAFGFGTSDNFIERARIINYGIDGMILNGRLHLKNGSTPNNPAEGGGVWLYKGDNSALLGFMGTQNNQNIGFFGGPGGWGFTYDAINSKVGIGNANPEACALLDVSSTTSGFLPPRMDSNQRNAIVSPSAGLTIYNTSIKAFQCYNGTAWYSTVHFIGENYGGGIVFYIYDNGQHSLIASTADQSSGIRWSAGTFTNTMAMANGIGAGKANTTLIIANQSIGDGATYAARICNEYYVTADGVTYGDWYLPSLNELLLLYLQKDLVGGFFNNYSYWSSNENFDSHASGVVFATPGGFTFGGSKSIATSVRAIRSF
jgi:hypothetical protein